MYQDVQGHKVKDIKKVGDIECMFFTLKQEAATLDYHIGFYPTPLEEDNAFTAVTDIQAGEEKYRKASCGEKLALEDDHAYYQ